MRTILFRGRRVDNGEWVEGYYCYIGYTNNQKHYIILDYASDLYTMEVIPETVGEYIGLQDKNGKKIFEGDILKCKCKKRIWEEESEEYVWGRWIEQEIIKDNVVQWWNSSCYTGYRLKEIKGTGTMIINNNRIRTMEAEVIGNIHDKEATK